MMGGGWRGGRESEVGGWVDGRREMKVNPSSTMKVGHD